MSQASVQLLSGVVGGEEFIWSKRCLERFVPTLAPSSEWRRVTRLIEAEYAATELKARLGVELDRVQQSTQL